VPGLAFAGAFIYLQSRDVFGGIGQQNAGGVTRRYFSQKTPVKRACQRPELRLRCRLAFIGSWRV